jgi:hypothetical protein
MTDLRPHLRQLQATTTAALRDHWRARLFLALVVLVPVLLFGVYQVRQGHTVHFGVLIDDKPYILGANDPEKGDFGQFRWTTEQTDIRLPAMGSGPYRLTLYLAGSANPHPTVAVAVNGTVLQTLNITPGLAPYTVEIPASATGSGDLRIQLRSSTFQSPGDRRQLGVVLHRAEIVPAGDAGVLLPPDLMVQFWAIILLAYLIAAIAGLDPRDCGIVGGAVALGGAVLLLVNRPWLGVWLDTGGLLRATVAGLILAILLRLALPPLYRLAGLRLNAGDVRWPVFLATLFFVMHFGGDLHPHTRVVDLGFHVNRYADVNERGTLLIYVQSREWGTRETIYPPTAYLFMRPLRFLAPDTLGTILLFIALSEATRLCLVYLIARKATQNQRAAVLACVVFGIVPMAYLPFSWGIATNVFGAWWLTAILAILVLGYDRLRHPAVAALLVISGALALLSHPGEFVLAATTLGLGVALFGLAMRPRFGGTWPIFLACVVVAGAVAFALLYRLVAADMLAKGADTISQKLGGGGTGEAPSLPGWRVGGAIDDPIIGLQGYRVTTVPALIWGGLVGYWREAVGYYTLWPAVLAFIGLWLMHGTKALARLRLASILWWSVAVIFALAGLLLNVYVRYAYYLLPVIAIGSGLTLARLMRLPKRLRPWGQFAAILLLTGTAAYGLWFWYLRISVDGH